MRSNIAAIMNTENTNSVMTMAGLRGVKTRTRVVVFVMSAFLTVIVVLLVVGAVNRPHGPPGALVEQDTAWAVLIAFSGAVAAGSVMMTGIEGQRARIEAVLLRVIDQRIVAAIGVDHRDLAGRDRFTTGRRSAGGSGS